MKRTTTFTFLLVITFLMLHFNGNAQYVDQRFLTGENISNFSIAQAPDRYTVAGTVTNANGRHEILVVSYDLQGVPQWSKTISEATNSRAMHIERVSDGYAITGWAREAGGNNELVFVRLDDQGNILINEKYHDANRSDWSLTGLHVLELDNSNGYLLTGYSIEIGFQLNSPKSAFAMRIDAQGNRMWSNYYDTPNDGDSDFDMASFAMKIPDGFFITGSLNLEKVSTATNQGVLLLKIDDQGNLIWQNGFAIDLDENWNEDFDLGTSALLDDNEIVVLANSTLSGSFNLAKVNPNSGFITTQHHNYQPVGEENTASFSIGKSTTGSYIIGGMMAESATLYDCDDNEIEHGAVSFICEISSDLTQVLTAKKYMMHNPDFTTGEGSIYNSHFSGPAGLNNPVIATPEMMCVDPNTYGVALLAYTQDRVLGAGHYDLQFIATNGPDFEWCSTRDIEFDLNFPKAIYSDNLKDEDVRNIQQDPTFTETNISLSTTACMLGNGSFPIRNEEVTGSKSVLAFSGRTLTYKDEEVYSMGFYGACSSHVAPFLEKFDANGNSMMEIEATITGSTMNGGTGVQVDNNKNMYICGGLNPGGIKWDSAPLIVAPTPTGPASSRTGYLIKYDANGNYLWQTVGFPSTTMNGALFSIQDFQLAPNGYLYAVGVASGYVSLETHYNGTNQTPNGHFFTFNGLDYTGFIIKIDTANGQVVGFKHSGPSTIPTLFDSYIVEQIEIDPITNELFAVGVWNGGIRVTHFDSNLNEISGSWLNKDVPAPQNNQYGVEVASTDLHGTNLYITGRSDGTINFDGITLTGVQSTKYHYVAKLDISTLPNPSFTAATKIEGAFNNIVVTDIMAMPDGDEIFVLGNTWAATNYYYSSTGSSISVSNAGNPSAIFLAKYDNALNTDANTSAWPSHYAGGSTTNTYSGSLALDYLNCGVMYSGSFYGGGINLGYPTPYGTPASDPSCPASNQSDMFIARAMPSSGVSYKKGFDKNESDAQTVFAHEDGLTLYPNPAHDVLQVRGVKAGEVIVLMNAQGQILSQHKAEGEEVQISKGTYAAGLYFIKIAGQQEPQTLRFIFE